MLNDHNRSTAMLDAAVEYIARKWQLVPLHEVNQGHCSCDAGANCRTPGKHPRTGPGWHRAENLVYSREAAEIWWAVGRIGGPPNIGLATGEASGFWALDVDPLNGGDQSLAELVDLFGELPPTRRHKTGSGGEHYLFALPTDFVVGGSKGDLPRGLDVRGNGGQIVAPPSITDRGDYAVADDAPILPAPEWLLALIRPKEPSAPAAAPWGELGEGWAAPTVGGSAESTRLRAYAASGAAGELSAIARATTGNRGITCVRAAYRLIELLNAPWSGLDPQSIWEQYVRAAQVAMRQGGKFDLDEATEAWKSAARKVGGRAAVAPPDPLAVVAMDPPSPSPFGLPPIVGAGDPVRVTPLSELAPPILESGDLAVDALIAEMLTAEEMASRPKPRPLVAGLLDLDTTAWLIAEPGAFKSFFSLDLACRVVNGQPWQGRRVQQGGVVYIAAEGSGGMSLRTDAWRREYGRIDPSLRFLPRPVQAADEAAWDVLVRACKRLGPSLVVIDTQARVTVGMEENSATEMGKFVEAAEAIRRATGACVLIIHHLGRNGTNARGSSALDGAQSTELRLVRRGKELAATVHQDKQKDADDSELIEITLRKVMMGHDIETGRELSSLVLDDVRTERVGPTDEEVRAAETMTAAGLLLQVLEEDFSKGLGGTKAEIMAVLLERRPGLSKSARNGAWLELAERDCFRSFERRKSHFRYVPLEKRVKLGEFRELFSEADQAHELVSR